MERKPGMKPATCLFALLLVSSVAAQAGKLVDKSSVVLPADTLATLQQRLPDILAIANQIGLYDITYLSDSLKVKGFLAMPRQLGTFPCVIFNRGGNREFGAITGKRAMAILGKIASWGYIAVASQYRGNAGSEGREEMGGAEIHDVLNLVPLLASLPEADTSRIGMFGWSRGGMMTYLALQRTCKLRAAIIGAGVADAFEAVESRPEMETYVFAELIPDYQTNKEAELRERSAIYWVDDLCKSTPLLLLHGSADWRVSPTQALRMASNLYESHHPFRFVFFEGGDHGLSEFRPEVDRLVRDWLDTYVRDGHKWPSLEPHGR